ncbi:YceI family protein [Bacteroidales bacterium AH-315-I05]|nr:YceI family protein [Bacteroidales bacterium AH-315-I05]
MKKGKLIVAGLFGLISGAAFGQTFTADINDGRNNARFESDAPLENIVGTTNKVSATLMINPKDITKNPKGKVIVKVASLKTGIDLRDEHMRSANYLNTGNYPEAIFMLTGLKASKKSLENTKAVNATASGKLTLHGVTKEVTVPVTLAYFKGDKKTGSKQPGNLLRVKASFNIKLSDYGINVPQMLFYKLDEKVSITIDVVASDAGGAAMAGCNPCGPSKAECNPCGPKKNAMKNTCNPCNPNK